MCYFNVGPNVRDTANPRSKNLDCRGFYSSIFLIVRGGIPRPIGNSLESLSQQLLVGIISVGRLGVAFPLRRGASVFTHVAVSAPATFFLGWHYSSNATCLVQASFVLFFVVSRTIIICYIIQTPCVRQPCVRQVVLDR